MSRRSSRLATKKVVSLPAGTTAGLASLVEGNESIIASMLSVDNLPKDTTAARTKLFASLTDCMAMNNLSAEALLARFFDASVLGAYCQRRLGVSSKGNGATLAARIAKAWSKPDFEPLPLEEEGGGKGKEKTSTKKPKAKDKGAKRTEKEEKSGKTKKKRMWTVDHKPSFTITSPPGPLGLTIKQYYDEFIVTDVSETVWEGPFPPVRAGDKITTIDGTTIESEKDIIDVSKKSREIGIGERIISNNAAEHSKGTLVHMKEAGFAMFRIMDYSDVAEKYGEDFLEELDPPNKGRSGRSILAGAMAALNELDEDD
eukprot:CAMPEP_0201870812 /NCGR_PEP_ID=MMETSP0902-20130614/3871_1 /ASSEMBLY_ACC=CAM_ASM_000551 /TAXON_ID=420261 /ORGANISM="Thalassiosira antarctica, Strain CCMP982" /LENGTH=314 /DNA_ID=CAMNT_0048396593 /DNA_START=95 /DNA_END=1039 /DNA_ORIENTATION=-